MVAPARVGVLEQVGAVEVGESKLVGGEVRGYPVEDDPDAVLVEDIDQVHEVLGGPEAAGNGEVAGGLVTPGSVEGVFHDRKELDMGESVVDQVPGEFRGELPVGERAAVFVRGAHP